MLGGYVLQFNLDRLVRMDLQYVYVYVYTTCSNENQVPVRVHHVYVYVCMYECRYSIAGLSALKYTHTNKRCDNMRFMRFDEM